MTVKYKSYVLKHMNTPFTIKVANEEFSEGILEIVNNIVKEVDTYLEKIENKFSPFKENSMVSRSYNLEDRIDFIFDEEYQEIYGLSLLAEKETHGVFSSFFENKYNPTGIVKGWAIEKIFKKSCQPILDIGLLKGIAINGGGDIQLGSSGDFYWEVGIENPKEKDSIIASYKIKNGAIATSGINKRGNHIIIKGDSYTQIQVTIIENSLTNADIWATTCLAATREETIKFIKTKKLTGIMVLSNKEIIPFEKGELIC